MRDEAGFAVFFTGDFSFAERHAHVCHYTKLSNYCTSLPTTRSFRDKISITVTNSKSTQHCGPTEERLLTAVIDLWNHLNRCPIPFKFVFNQVFISKKKENTEKSDHWLDDLRGTRRIDKVGQ